mgnify:CR=1 FL=1
MKTELFTEFLRAVSCGLKGEEYAGGGDLRKLYVLSKKHGVENLFYLAIKKSCADAEVLRVAKKAYDMNVNLSFVQKAYADETLSRLAEAGVKILLLKGDAIKSVYPRPDMRYSADVDFYYEKKQNKKVKKTLTEAGFKLTHKNYQHACYEKYPVTLEAHYSLSFLDKKSGKYYDNAFLKATEIKKNIYRLNLSDEYIYFLTHAAKHFKYGGFGVKSVADNYCFLNAGLDFNYVEKELASLNLLKFYAAFKNVAENWFGETPLSDDGANYGTHKNYAAMNFTGEKSGKKYFMSKIFPSAKILSQKYPALEKAPVLLPVFWVVRAVGFLFRKDKKAAVKGVVKTSGAVDEKTIKTASDAKRAAGFDETE